MRIASVTILTLLVVASFSKGAAIRATSAAPIMTLKEYFPKPRVNTETTQLRTSQSPSAYGTYVLENGAVDRSSSVADEPTTPTGMLTPYIEESKSYKIKRTEYDKLSSESEDPLEFKKMAVGQENLGKMRCPYSPVSAELQARLAYIPDSLTLHQAATRNGPILMRSGETENHSARLPTGCFFMMVQNGEYDITCSGTDVLEVPEFNHVRKVKELEFIDTSIQRVTMEHIDNLPRTITSLSFNNGILTIFDGRTLKYKEGLQTLSLRGNFLSDWSFAMVFMDDEYPNATNTISFIDLRDNFIFYPPDPMGSKPVVMPNLETIALNNNPIGYLPGKLFQPLKNSPVKRLYMKNCSLCDFKAHPLSHLRNLTVLDLSANTGLDSTRIKEFLSPLVNGSLQELYLAQNNYRSVPTEALAQVNSSLEILDLHASALTCLDNTSFPIMPKLKKLNLMYCRIYSIEEDTFGRLPLLEELLLDGNSLQSFPSALLLPSIRKLSIIENPTYTGGDIAYSFNLENVNLTKMINLHTLYLDKVRLTEVKSSYFSGLYELQHLSLKECSIVSIEPSSFKDLGKLEELYLEGNKLTLLLNGTFSGLTNLTKLFLTNNAITFYSPDVIYPMEGQKNDSSLRKTSQEQVNVQIPERVLGKPETRTIDSVLASIRVPQPLSMWLSAIQNKQLTMVGNDASLQMQSDGMEPKAFFPFKNLKNLKVLELTDNDIRSLHSEIFEDLVNLKTLHLSENEIKQWYQPLLQKSTRLNSLLLDKNSITSLTDAMVIDFSKEYIQQINLLKNEFECNCSLHHFEESLDSSNFYDFPSYVCYKDKRSYNMTLYIEGTNCTSPPSINDDPDSPGYNLKPILMTTVAVPLLLSVTLFFAYRKRWYIRYIVYSVKAGIRTYKEDADHYLYDTFICYSQSDRQWVFEYLLTMLEDVAKYRVCVHERDFTVGQEITENIIQSVEKSRKVIVVLSPAFVSSSWCMFELQMASNKILDERKSKLIAVILEPIEVKQQPKKLRLLLKTRTYIAWDGTEDRQRVFWARLFKAVDKPSNRDSVFNISSLVDASSSSPPSIFPLENSEATSSSIPNTYSPSSGSSDSDSQSSMDESQGSSVL